MTTKIYKYIGFGVASVMALSACSDKFLEEKRNFDNVTDEVYNYFEGAQSRVDDVYSWCLPTIGDLAWNNPSMGNNDLAGGSTEEYTGFSKFVDPEVNPGGGGLSSMSSDTKIQVPDFFMYSNNNIQASVYGRIRNINDCMAGVENSTLEQDKKNVLLGQLYFFRGWCYYNLVKWYGGVPIVEGTPAPEEGVYFERKSAKACFDYILNDLRKSAELLKGQSMTGSNYGRVTSGTALALKGRVLTLWCSPMFNRKDNAERWQAAYEEMKADLAEINGTYGLYTTSGNQNGSDFAGQFLVAGENKEAVFFTLYNKVVSDDGLDNQKNNSWERAIRPSNTGGSGKRPSKMMMDMFPMADGKVPANISNYSKLPHSTSSPDPQAPFVNRDPRFNRTFAFPGFRWAYTGDPTQRDGHNPSYNQGRDYVLWSYVWYTSKDDAGDPTGGNSYASDNLSGGGVYLRKKSDDLDVNASPLYDYAPKAEKGAGPFFSCATLMELRYAEVLLNMAEVACGAKHAGTGEGEAQYYLNMVRQRAGVPDWNLSGEDVVMSAILYERQIEFAYEGKRFDDMRRWMLYDGGTVLPDNAPETWKLEGRWASGTDVWLGFKKFNGQRRESISIRSANSYGIGGTLWNEDPILKTALTAAATDYTNEWNAQNPDAKKPMTIKKASQVMSVYETAAAASRPISADMRDASTLTALQGWYATNLSVEEKKGDARDAGQNDEFITYLPKYYFLGLTSGAQNANKHVAQTIGWEDYNKGGAPGTFDPLAE